MYRGRGQEQARLVCAVRLAVRYGSARLGLRARARSLALMGSSAGRRDKDYKDYKDYKAAKAEHITGRGGGRDGVGGRWFSA